MTKSSPTFLGLGVKFIAITILILALTLGLSTAHLVKDQHLFFRTQLIEKAEVLGRFVSFISPEAILAYDFTTLNDFVTEITRQNDIVYAAVLSDKGVPLTSHFDKEQPQVAEYLEQTGSIDTDVDSLIMHFSSHDAVIPLRFPINYEGRQLGTVEMAIDTERLRERSRMMFIQQSVEYVLIIIFLSFCIYIVFRYNVLRPVGNLVIAAGRVARGDYDKPVDVIANDELGRLTQTFNRMMGVIRDEQEMLRKLSLAVEQSPASVVITDPKGVIEYVNPTFSNISGFSSKEAVGETPNMFKSGLTPQRTYQELWETILAGETWSGELQNRKKSGEFYWEHITIAPIKNIHGKITHFVAVKEDISVRKAYEERLFQQANFDTLTALPNRSLAMDRLSQLLKSARRESSRLAVMFVDLDNFKKVNDTLGHSAGDELLRDVAHRLTSQCRANDTVARLGGDEFLVLLPQAQTKEDAATVANKILSVLNQPFHIGGQEVFISSSIGVAFFPDDGEESGLLLRHADSAMYEAKLAGKNTYRHYTHDLDNRIVEQMGMENLLHHALERKEMQLHYQPIISFNGGCHITGVEALLRWHNPQLGVIQPTDFVPLAEELGIMGELGAWVLRHSFNDIQPLHNQQGEPLQLFINLSKRQFSSADIHHQIDDALKLSGIAPQRIHTEVTEKLFQEQGESARTSLRLLQDKGIKIVLDDFGTGDSSLNYLREFPVDVLKVDRTFITTSDQNSESQTLVKAIIGLGLGLNLKIIGEGVESEEQLKLLQQAGVSRVQGNLFSPAVDIDTLGQMLSAPLSDNCYPDADN